MDAIDIESEINELATEPINEENIQNKIKILKEVIPKARLPQIYAIRKNIVSTLHESVKKLTAKLNSEIVQTTTSSNLTQEVEQLLQRSFINEDFGFITKPISQESSAIIDVGVNSISNLSQITKTLSGPISREKIEKNPIYQKFVFPEIEVRKRRKPKQDDHLLFFELEQPHVDKLSQKPDIPIFNYSSSSASRNQLNEQTTTPGLDSVAEVRIENKNHTPLQDVSIEIPQHIIEQKTPPGLHSVAEVRIENKNHTPLQDVSIEIPQHIVEQTTPPGLYSVAEVRIENKNHTLLQDVSIEIPQHIVEQTTPPGLYPVAEEPQDDIAELITTFGSLNISQPEQHMLSPTLENPIHLPITLNNESVNAKLLSHSELPNIEVPNGNQSEASSLFPKMWSEILRPKADTKYTETIRQKKIKRRRRIKEPEHNPNNTERSNIFSPFMEKLMEADLNQATNYESFHQWRNLVKETRNQRGSCYNPETILTGKKDNFHVYYHVMGDIIKRREIPQASLLTPTKFTRLEASAGFYFLLELAGAGLITMKSGVVRMK